MSADAGRLRLNDALRVTSVGLRARPLRAALSALGIAIGTAAIVAVLGLSSSSQAGLLAEIDRLGTNMLTLEAGQSLTGQEAQLPREAPGRITLLDHVDQVAHTALIKGKSVYRSRLIPVTNTSGLQVRATSLDLLSVLNSALARGAWLNPGTAREPVAVLGWAAAQRLGIDRIFPDQRIWLLVAPRARRRPISERRSSTEMIMMLATPTAPTIRATTPRPRKRLSNAPAAAARAVSASEGWLTLTSSGA